MNWESGSSAFEPALSKTEAATAKPAQPLKPFSTELTEEDLTGKPPYGSNQPTTPRVMMLHFGCLHLHMIDYIKENMLGDVSVKITWKFFQFQQSSSRKISNNPSISFGTTYKYTLQITKAFFERIRTAPLKLELSVCNESEELLLSTAEVYFGKLFGTRKSVDVRFSGTGGGDDGCWAKIGKLSLWYEVSAAPEKLNKTNAAPEKLNESNAALAKLDETNAAPEKLSETNAALAKLDETVEEATLAADEQSKVPCGLRNTQSEMSNEMRKMLNKQSQKMAWKKTLQKNTRVQLLEEMQSKPVPGIPSSKFSHLGFRNDADFPKLTINIKKLYLFPDTSLNSNKAIKKIYLEYELLGYSGPDMEMPHSMAKPQVNQWLDIDFVKAFPIHLEHNYEVCKAIAAMIKNEQPIKFSLVSEPDEDPRVNIQTCKEIGFSTMSLGDLVEIEEDECEYEYDVFDSSGCDGVVGVLVVSVGGIVALKKLAFTLWHL